MSTSGEWGLNDLVIRNITVATPTTDAGAKMIHYFPVSIPSNGSVLNITVQSYLDNLDFGLIACRAAVPDIEKLTEFLAEEFEHLKKAAGETPEKKIRKIEIRQVKAAQRSA